MNFLAPESNAALAPLRQALRTNAEEQAADIRHGASLEAAGLLASAREQAAQILARATREGEDSARSQAALRSSRVRREAQELVLAQRSAVLAELRRQLRARVSALRDDPRYPALVAGLTEHCRTLLGPSARVSESPDGGVIAEAGTRRLDLSLPVLAELALESMPEESELWTR
ncbi:hypothetical protein AS189_13410 [Arthrobacter alpinus]|uniref:ATP synthase subunit E n=1 Tax=Arthrobacter alpinus TaxID=656366 RepID=A0A0S2M127_9MICC|nr:V-type ATP synthase subunit E family protein [Arthrobacter alpinus]ALO67313.1 hypothetical protein AS189_13410 [Arthrobacter alpinus]